MKYLTQNKLIILFLHEIFQTLTDELCKGEVNLPWILDSVLNNGHWSPYQSSERAWSLIPVGIILTERI